MIQRHAELLRIRIQLTRVFTPESPITQKDSFQGRQAEMTKVLEAVLKPGAHVVIFGERGVGKTSLAVLIEEFWRDEMKDNSILMGRVNCEPSDDYVTVWANIAEDIEARLTPPDREENPRFAELIRDMSIGAADPALVRRTFQAHDSVAVIIIDEFDRLEDRETVQRMADTIKGLSDYSVNATLVIVGVASTVDNLIEDHASVDRSLTQILMPRLDQNEIMELVESRYDTVGISYDTESIRFIANLTRGLPYYAHLIGQSAGLAAVKNETTVVGMKEVAQGLGLATENAQESVKRNYYEAVSSSRPDSVYREVFLACALAERDEFGFFTAAAVRSSLSEHLGIDTTLARCLTYLERFTEEEHGRVLQMEGQPCRRRYRFADPLLETYVILKGIQDGLVSADLLMA